MKGNVELLDMCMCIVFAFQLIRAKKVRIDIEVKRSEEKWREVMTCDVSPVAMFCFGFSALYCPNTAVRLWWLCRMADFYVSSGSCGTFTAKYPRRRELDEQYVMSPTFCCAAHWNPPQSRLFSQNAGCDFLQEAVLNSKGCSLIFHS